VLGKKIKNLLPNGGEKWWFFMVQSEASPYETNPTSVQFTNPKFSTNGWNLKKSISLFLVFGEKSQVNLCFSISRVYLCIYLIEANATPLYLIYSSLSFLPYQVASTIYNES